MTKSEVFHQFDHNGMLFLPEARFICSLSADKLQAVAPAYPTP